MSFELAARNIATCSLHAIERWTNKPQTAAQESENREKTLSKRQLQHSEQRKLAENFFRNMEDTVEELLRSLDVWALRMPTRRRIFTVYHWCWVHAKERNWFILDRFCRRKWRKLGEISSNHNLLQQQSSSGVRIWSSTIARNRKDSCWKIKNPSAPDCSAQESQIEQKPFQTMITPQSFLQATFVEHLLWAEIANNR